MATKTFDEWWDSFPRERYTYSYGHAKEGWNACAEEMIKNFSSHSSDYSCALNEALVEFDGHYCDSWHRARIRDAVVKLNMEILPSE